MSRLHDPEALVVHAHARLTPHGRWLLVQRVRVHGRPVAHVARELGISRQCAHRWVARFDAEGRAGLADRSSRPHCSPTATAPERVALVLAARTRLRRGPDELARATGVPARTVSRILRRAAVPYLWQCDPITGELIRASKLSAVRYEHPHPGDLVHIDVKKIGRIRARIGFDYVHAAVDDHSRIAYAEVLPDEKGTTCAGFIDRAPTYFAALGAPVRAVITDNHWSYAHTRDVADTLAAHQAQHWFIKAHCPLQNGKHRTLQPHPGQRMGLPTTLAHQRRPHRSLHDLADLLQH
jgi:transposase-like protein